jgi:hypothetical protein
MTGDCASTVAVAANTIAREIGFTTTFCAKRDPRGKGYLCAARPAQNLFVLRRAIG